MLWTPPDTGFSTTEAADLAGVTFRQIDYWHRRGHIRPTLPDQGRARRWSARDVLSVWVYGQLWTDNSARDGTDDARLRSAVLDACYSQTGWWLVVHPTHIGFTSDLEADLPRDAGMGGVVYVLSLAPLASRFADLPAGYTRWEHVPAELVFGESQENGDCSGLAVTCRGA